MLFLFVTPSFAQSFASLEPEEQAKWSALLHYFEGELKIPDKSFILSLPNFSPESEWRKTIASFKSNPDYICKFPARYNFIKNTSAVDQLPEFPSCIDYSNYKSKAPADLISLVYASENLSNPSSIMGHSFFAIEGIRSDGRFARHSASFFIELNSINLPKIAYETLIAGKDGYFLVKPLKRHYDYYNREEQRNIWRYKLDLSSIERGQISDHIWELKTPPIAYYFNKHNCANLLLDILRIIKPELKQGHTVSPLDLVKIAKQNNLVTAVDLEPSPRWRIRFLGELLSADYKDEVSQWLDGNQGKPIYHGDQKHVADQFLLASLEYRYETGELLDDEFLEKYDQIPKIDADDAHHFSLGEDWSPANAFDDANISFGTGRIDGDLVSIIQFSPASRSIEDGKQQRFTESIMKLGEVKIGLNLDAEEVYLEDLQLYSVLLIQPVDQITGGISGRFGLSISNVYDSELKRDLYLKIGGGIGLAKQLLKDVRIYGFFNIDLLQNDKRGLATFGPQIGLIIYEIFKMKTVLDVGTNFLDQASQKYLNLIQSISMDESLFALEASHYEVRDRYKTDWMIKYKYFF